MVLVLPLHMEFIRSGEFTVRDRLAAAARWAASSQGGRGWRAPVMTPAPSLPPWLLPPLPCVPMQCIRYRYNLLYYGALLAAGLAGIVLLLVSGRLHVANIAGLAIACSNAYGLIAGGVWVDGRVGMARRC